MINFVQATLSVYLSQTSCGRGKLDNIYRKVDIYFIGFLKCLVGIRMRFQGCRILSMRIKTQFYVYE